MGGTKDSSETLEGRCSTCLFWQRMVADNRGTVWETRWGICSLQASEIRFCGETQVMRSIVTRDKFGCVAHEPRSTCDS
jgi:hypothetical protein